MPTKTPLPPAIHNITFCGMTGAIFFFLTVAVVLYIEAFVTTSWSVASNKTSTEYTGLWQTCAYRPREQTTWVTTSQVLISIGLFGVAVSFILSTIYMTANRASKNVTITSLAFVCFVTVVFIVIGVTVYGINAGANAQLSWSFGVTVAAAILTFVAGMLTIVQLLRSNVHIC